MKGPQPTAIRRVIPGGWSAALLFGMVEMLASWRPDGATTQMRHSIPQAAERQVLRTHMLAARSRNDTAGKEVYL